MSRDAGSAGRPVLLVVDDLAIFRELGTLWLSRFGRVVTAASAGEAWQSALAERPDLVVLDLGLPDEPGAEWCRRAKAQPELAGVPILALASGGRAAEHAAAVRAGADDVLAKPLERMALVESAARFLGASGPRGLPRAPLEAPVRWWSGAREASATARNVSRGGLFLESEAVLPVASELRLELSLPASREPVVATAHVVWRSGRSAPAAGMGVRFVDLDRASARTLAHHVREWQGDGLASAGAPLLPQEIAPVKLRTALLLALALGFSPLPALAGPASGQVDAAVDPATEAHRRDLDDALARLGRARERARNAESAYESWRQRKWPRGERKAEILTEREAARTEWEEAREDLPRLIERARRDGVPPGELRPYEDAARAELAAR